VIGMPHKTAQLGWVFPGAGAIGGPEAGWLASVASLGWPMIRSEVDDRSRLLRLSWIASQSTGLMGGLCGVRFRHGKYLGPASAAACWLERGAAPASRRIGA